MAQHLEALTVSEDLLSLTPVPEELMLLPGLHGYCTQVERIHISKRNTHTHKTKIKSFYKKWSTIKNLFGVILLLIGPLIIVKLYKVLGFLACKWDRYSTCFVELWGSYLYCVVFGMRQYSVVHCNVYLPILISTSHLIL